MTGPTLPIGEAAKAAGGVAKPLYEDLVQPAAKELGTALGRTVRTLLVPLRAVVWGAERAEEYVHGALMKRLKNVPPEQLVTPKLNIAGPAVQALQFAGNESTLREMYANLLATAMDKQTAEQAHPAFVEIIKQLAPDEARIMVYVPKERLRPVISLYSTTPGSATRKEVLRHFSLIGVAAGCSHPHLSPSYLENLCRLGLMEMPFGLHDPDDTAYPPLETHADVVRLKEQIEAEGKTPRIVREVFDITNFGRQFIRACVLERTPGEVPAPGRA